MVKPANKKPSEQKKKYKRRKVAEDPVSSDEEGEQEWVGPEDEDEEDEEDEEEEESEEEEDDQPHPPHDDDDNTGGGNGNGGGFVSDASMASDDDDDDGAGTSSAKQAAAGGAKQAKGARSGGTVKRGGFRVSEFKPFDWQNPKHSLPPKSMGSVHERLAGFQWIVVRLQRWGLHGGLSAVGFEDEPLFNAVVAFIRSAVPAGERRAAKAVGGEERRADEGALRVALYYARMFMQGKHNATKDAYWARLDSFVEAVLDLDGCFGPNDVKENATMNAIYNTIAVQNWSQYLQRAVEGADVAAWPSGRAFAPSAEHFYNTLISIDKVKIVASGNKQKNMSIFISCSVLPMPVAWDEDGLFPGDDEIEKNLRCLAVSRALRLQYSRRARSIQGKDVWRQRLLPGVYQLLRRMAKEPTMDAAVSTGVAGENAMIFRASQVSCFIHVV